MQGGKKAGGWEEGNGKKAGRKEEREGRINPSDQESVPDAQGTQAWLFPVMLRTYTSPSCWPHRAVS